MPAAAKRFVRESRGQLSGTELGNTVRKRWHASHQCHQKPLTAQGEMSPKEAPVCRAGWQPSLQPSEERSAWIRYLSVEKPKEVLPQLRSRATDD